MRKLSAFVFVSLNGFYKGAEGDLGWHRHGPEETDFSLESLQAGHTLLFGRVTYDLMAAFWSSPQAALTYPEVAGYMNRADKVVFSSTLKHTHWSNTRLVQGNLITEISQLKASRGNDLTLLGSGQVLTQLAEHDLNDTYKIMIDPVVLNTGTPLFQGLKHPLHLVLKSTRPFRNGSVLLRYVSSKPLN